MNSSQDVKDSPSVKLDTKISEFISNMQTLLASMLANVSNPEEFTKIFDQLKKLLVQSWTDYLTNLDKSLQPSNYEALRICLDNALKTIESVEEKHPEVKAISKIVTFSLLDVIVNCGGFQKQEEILKAFETPFKFLAKNNIVVSEENTKNTAVLLAALCMVPTEESIDKCIKLLDQCKQDNRLNSGIQFIYRYFYNNAILEVAEFYHKTKQNQLALQYYTEAFDAARNNFETFGDEDFQNFGKHALLNYFSIKQEILAATEKPESKEHQETNKKITDLIPNMQTLLINFLTQIDNQAEFIKIFNQIKNLLLQPWTMYFAKLDKNEQASHYEPLCICLEDALKTIELVEKKYPEAKAVLKKGSRILAEVLTEYRRYNKRPDDEAYKATINLLWKNKIIVSEESTHHLATMLTLFSEFPTKESVERCIQLLNDCKQDARLNSDKQYIYRLFHNRAIFNVGEFYHKANQNQLALNYYNLAVETASLNLKTFEEGEHFEVIRRCASANYKILYMTLNTEPLLTKMLTNVRNPKEFTKILEQVSHLLVQPWSGYFDVLESTQILLYTPATRCLDSAIDAIQSVEEKHPEVKATLKKIIMVMGKLFVDMGGRSKHPEEKIQQILEAPIKLIAKNSIVASEEKTKDISILFNVLNMIDTKETINRRIALLEECKKDDRLNLKSEYIYRFFYNSTLSRIAQYYQTENQNELALSHYKLVMKLAKDNFEVFATNDFKEIEKAALSGSKIMDMTSNMQTLLTCLLANLQNQEEFAKIFNQIKDFLVMPWKDHLSSLYPNQKALLYKSVRTCLDDALIKLESIEEKHPHVKEVLKKGALVLGELILEFGKFDDKLEQIEGSATSARLLAKCDVNIKKETTEDLSILFKIISQGNTQASIDKCKFLVDECKNDARLVSKDQYEYRFSYNTALLYLAGKYLHQNQIELAIQYYKLTIKIAQHNKKAFPDEKNDDDENDFDVLLSAASAALMDLGELNLRLFVPVRVVPDNKSAENKDQKDFKDQKTDRKDQKGPGPGRTA